MLKNATVFLMVLFFPVVLSISLYAQVSTVVSKMNVGDAKEGQDFMIGAELVQAPPPSRVMLYYRAFGETEFKQVEMILHGNYAEYIIPGSVINPPFIEYYLNVTLQTGASETYPLGAPIQAGPLQVKVLPGSPKDKEIIFLSPEKNKSVGSKDFFVSISLLHASGDVDKAATKVYVDNVDITANVLFAEDLLLFYADNFPQKFDFGKHEIRVELYDTNKKLYHAVNNSFTLVSDEYASELASGLSYHGQVTAESRNENVSNVNTWYNNVDANLSGSYKNWDMSARVFVTSEEKAYLQPNDRFSLDIHSDWLSVSAGDHFPNYPSLIAAGKRLRGITGAITLGGFNIITSYGQLTRKVEGSGLDSLYYPGGNNPALGANIISLDPSKFGGATEGHVNSLGTYSRNMFAIRPYFGKGDNFQFGLTYLHSADDPGSIALGSKPSENVVLGTDLLVGIDDQHVLFTGQAAISMQNTDISSGNMADSTFRKFLNTVDSSLNPDDYINYKNSAQHFITINQFLSPLNPTKLSSLASEANLSVNYFDNYLKGSYIYRGSDYQSYANSYLRTNIEGYNIMDRLRLLENKLFVSLSYENLHDNLSKITDGTTTFQTYSGSVSYFPGTGLPGFLVSYFSNNNSNDLTITPASLARQAMSMPDSTVYDPKIDEQINRISAQVSYDFFYLKQHRVALIFSSSNRDDKTLYNNDGSSYSISLSTNTVMDENFTINFSFSLNHSTLNQNTIHLYKDSTVANDYVTAPINPDKPTDDLDYTSISLGGQYWLLNRQMNIAANLNPTFGDFQRFKADLSAQYFIQKNFNVQLFVSYMVNSKLPNIVGTLYNDSTVRLLATYGL